MHGCPQKQGGSWDNILLSYARNNGRKQQKKTLKNYNYYYPQINLEIYFG